MKSVGSRAEVWHGNALKTSGGLTKDKLTKNKHGRIVSKAKQALGRKALKHLHDAGYVAVKGKLGVTKKSPKKSPKKRRKSKKKSKSPKKKSKC